MRANEFIVEYKVDQTLKAPGKSQFEFQSASGMIYTISIARMMKGASWLWPALKHDSDMEDHSELLISFTTTDPKTGRLTNDRTNTGDSIAIFRTVQSTLLNYLNALPKERLPDQLMFVADSQDASRVSLYNTIAHSNRIPNYSFYTKMPSEHSNQILFIMQREEIDESITEAPLADYQPLGDFNKPGPFRGPDKKLIPHPVNQLKTQQFLSNSPHDFRLFFSHIPGTSKYREYGPMKPDVAEVIFGDDAAKILNGHENAITIVYVGNSGDSKVPLTPWVMAHRFGHAIQSGHRRAAPMGGRESGAWPDAEQYFFSTVNQLLDRAYGKPGKPGGNLKYELTPEYNALFNAIGTQRSSRSGAIRRPYEFLYELFAQYIKDGKITLNPLPTNLGYGKQAWGNPSKYMYLKQEYRDQDTRQYEAQGLADDLSDYFAEVLRSAVGQIYVM